MARDLAGGSAPGWHLNFLCRTLCRQLPMSAIGKAKFAGVVEPTIPSPLAEGRYFCSIKRWAVCHICSSTSQCRVDKSEALFMGLNEQRCADRTAMVAKGEAPRDVACSPG